MVLTLGSAFVNILHVETSLTHTLTAVTNRLFRRPAVAIGSGKQNRAQICDIRLQGGHIK
jgi:hypothetical protein